MLRGGLSVLLRKETAVLRLETALRFEEGRVAHKGGRFVSNVLRTREAGMEQLSDIRIGLLEQLSPTASVAHREEGAGGRGPSHGVVVLVHADFS
jgi:hypothetical protein